jgi:hypothetical protein
VHIIDARCLVKVRVKVRVGVRAGIGVSERLDLLSMNCAIA